jgi:hypothetical protein
MSALSMIMMFAAQIHCLLSMSLRPVNSANGSPFCGLGSPLTVMSTDDIVGIEMGVPGQTRCAYRCVGMSSTSGCVGFNYIQRLPMSGQCQFFGKFPIFCDTKIPGCRFYEVRIQDAIFANIVL